MTLATAAPAECLGGKKDTLIAGGFSGALVCSPKDAQFILVGRTEGQVRYSIYLYHYRFLPHPGGVMHGGQRILVFEGNKYIGQYVLNPPPPVATVHNEFLILKAGDGESAMVDFSKGPPSSISVDGETEEFSR
jgi:hypothetical protein